MEYLNIYHAEVPVILQRLCETPAMQRLQKVGMNCGCEYTSFPRFLRCGTYSRYEHSLGVGLIVWHFTHDEKQAAAGLLHDISTPVFAHVIDFLNGDHLTQESTELDTRAVIMRSPQIVDLLRQYGLTADKVCDYHRYPVADNDTPRLSADRLEYTIGNALHYGFADRKTVQTMYDDLTVGKNEQGIDELMFRTRQTALLFARTALRCSKVYVSDEDRFSMEALANLLKDALLRGVLVRSDLQTAEPAVIEKLLSDQKSAAAWQTFRAYAVLHRSAVPQEEGLWYRVDAKKRHINPCVCGEGRVTALYPQFAEELSAFLALSFDQWLSASPAMDLPAVNLP